MLEIATSCRACMKSDVTLVDLFQPLQLEDGRCLQLDQILNTWTPTQVSPEDGLPRNVCCDCVKSLQTCHDFSVQVQNADTEFRRLISTHEPVKLEPKIKIENACDDKFDYDFDYAVEAFDYDECKLEALKEKEEDCPYKCEECKKSFSQKSKFLKHRCPIKYKFSCNICSKIYRKKSSLEAHLAKHSKKHKCLVCNECFETESLLSYHTDKHKTDTVIKKESDVTQDLFQCSECPVAFNKAHSLSLHKKKHTKKDTPTRSYVCDICTKVFSLKNLLKRHMKLHAEERPFGCTKCSKKYSRQDELEAHIRFKHDMIKPYVCSTCSKAFTQRCNLLDHERTHTGETPYLCSECGKGFRNSSNLRQHLQRHTGIKPFACKLCPMTFATKGQMTTHLGTHTGAHPYTCEQCGVAFTKPSSLKKHKLIHLGVRPFVCTTCNMRFTCKYHLTRHERIHTGEKPYKCSYCERAFTQCNDLVKHTRAHVGQNVYQCKICDMRFRLCSELKQHYPSHYADSETVQNQQLFKKTHEEVKALSDPSAGGTTEKQFDRTITITFNGDGLAKDAITINIRPEDILKDL